MTRTPGFVIPSSFSSEEDLKRDIDRRSKSAGFVPIDFSMADEVVTHTESLDDFLEHYGVKGMKWGKRKASSPRAKGYDNTRRRTDKQVFGNRGVNRINDRMNSGKTWKQAVRRESTRQTVKTVAALAALSYAPVVADTAVRSLNTAVLAKQASNGAKAAAKIFASEKGLTNYQTIQSTYNSVKDIWE